MNKFTVLNYSKFVDMIDMKLIPSLFNKATLKEEADKSLLISIKSLILALSFLNLLLSLPSIPLEWETSDEVEILQRKKEKLLLPLN